MHGTKTYGKESFISDILLLRLKISFGKIRAKFGCCLFITKVKFCMGLLLTAWNLWDSTTVKHFNLGWGEPEIILAHSKQNAQSNQ